MKNRQPNTFANWHLSNDENPTKINVFEIALDNQKQQWKSKRSKDKFQENGNKQLSRNEGANGHKNGFVKQTKGSPKQNEHKDWIQYSYSAKTEQSRFLTRNLVCQKQWRLQSTKTRLILLITRENLEQDAPC